MRRGPWGEAARASERSTLSSPNGRTGRTGRTGRSRGPRRPSTRSTPSTSWSRSLTLGRGHDTGQAAGRVLVGADGHAVGGGADEEARGRPDARRRRGRGSARLVGARRHGAPRRPRRRGAPRRGRCPRRLGPGRSGRQRARRRGGFTQVPAQRADDERQPGRTDQDPLSPARRGGQPAGQVAPVGVANGLVTRLVDQGVAKAGLDVGLARGGGDAVVSHARPPLAGVGALGARATPPSRAGTRAPRRWPRRGDPSSTGGRGRRVGGRAGWRGRRPGHRRRRPALVRRRRRPPPARRRGRHAHHRRGEGPSGPEARARSRQARR